MEEEVYLNPPTEKEVINRALCLSVLFLRSQAEAIYLSSPDKEIFNIESNFFQEVEKWIEEENLKNSFTEQEKILLEKELGKWDEKETLLSFTYLESLGVLFWALSLIDKLPPYDVGFKLNDVINGIPVLKSKEEFLGKVKLRPFKELIKERDIAEMWYFRWKLGRMEKENYKLEEGKSYKDALKLLVEKALSSGAISYTIEDDFPVQGKPFSRVSGEDYLFLSGIILERFLTLNWLCGSYKSWDERKEY
jgi:hypothetical protein